MVEKDEDWSCEEGDDGDEEEDVTDDESSDASEDLKYKRKRPLNSQQKGRKAVGPTAKEQKPFTAQLKVYKFHSFVFFLFFVGGYVALNLSLL